MSAVSARCRADGGGAGSRWQRKSKKRRVASVAVADTDAASSSAVASALDDLDDADDDADDAPSIVSNGMFERYYSETLAPLLDADEFALMIQTLKTRLPTTFRLSSINGLHRALQQHIADNVWRLETPPTPLPWYPDNMAFYLPMSKADLRRLPFARAFRQWLMDAFAMGNLNRQEAVSMIPPLLLDVQPHHVVLDMCAAPGSKTAQLLEALHTQTATSPADVGGMVIANDNDAKRAFLLVHQLKRLGSPAFVVTTHDGQFFPNIFGADDALIRFDRILCDVPCSGDGTMRKNANLWSKWSNQFALGLHPLQINIALRSMQMLADDGIMVYSTCSFNPIENEAVVCEILRRHPAAELMDTSNMLPALIRSHGLETWRIMTGGGEWLDRPPSDSASLSASSSSSASTSSLIKASMFPPNDDERKRFHLDRTMRILPHRQDTGGFFIALIKKTAIGTAEAVPPLSTNDVASDDAASASRFVADDPFRPLNDDVSRSIIDFYGLSDHVDHTNFFARSSSNKKCYFVGRRVASLLQAKRNRRLKIVHSGSRCYEKCSVKASAADSAVRSCEYRLVQEGIDAIAPFMTRQLVPATLADLRHLLRRKLIPLSELCAGADAFSVGVVAAQSGCIVLSSSMPNVAKPIYVAAWKTPRSLALMISDTERTSLLGTVQETTPTAK